MKRYIKSDINNDILNLNPKSKILHPQTLKWIVNDSDESLCITKYFLDKNNIFKKTSNYKCLSNNDKYKEYLYVPPLGLSSNDLLQIYNIDSIESLHTWIEDSNLLEPETIIRILNCWIKVNYDILEKYNKILVDIINNIITQFYSHLIGNFDLNKETLKFITNWLSIHNSSDFHFDLINDYIEYIKKNI